MTGVSNCCKRRASRKGRSAFLYTGKRPAGTKGRGRPGNRKPSRCRNPCRGRCLHRPGNPAAAGTFPVLNFDGAAGVNARPTGRGNMAARRESTGPAPPQTPVGADSISVRFAVGQGPAGGHGPPAQTMANTRPNGTAPGRCFHSGRGRAYLWCCCNGECQNGYSAPCSASRPCSPVRILTAFSTS